MKRSRSVRILHVITDLHVGGAQVVLLRLLRGSDRSRFDPAVVSLDSGGRLRAPIEQLGIPVWELGMRSGSGPRNLSGLFRTVRDDSPDVIQTWMYHADLIGGLAGHFAGDVPIVWGVHHTDMPSGGIKWSTRLVAAINRRLARLVPDHIVFCSETAAAHHRGRGYPVDRSSIITNGFEIVPTVPGARRWLRTELGLGQATPLVGRVGRFHPQKDYRTFVAATELVAEETESNFVLCGEGLTPENAELLSWLERAGVADRTHLLGLRDDIDRIHAGLDVAVSSSSFGEAFPLVIGEAMLQCTPVVVTDVGDSREIVGKTGVIVEPASPFDLANGIIHVLQMSETERRQLGLHGRQRIIERFSLERMVMQYQRTYEHLL